MRDVATGSHGPAPEGTPAYGTGPSRHAGNVEPDAEQRRAQPATEVESFTRERRDADKALVDYLAKQNFAGQDYNYFVQRLAEYGFSTILSWLNSGRIFREVKKRGYSVSEFYSMTTEDRRDIASDTVMAAAPLFRHKALEGGSWNPDGGASLASYYIGACVYVFPNVYRKWARQRAKLENIIPSESLSHPAVQPAGLRDSYEKYSVTSVEDAVTSAVRVEEILAGLPFRYSEVLRLLSLGHTQADIAKRLDLTRKAVENIAMRARRLVRDRLERENAESGS
jgi:DNA-directed RNA polymerase specialized sigma24 family protein